MSYYVPNIYEKQGGIERAYDVFSRLLIDRIIFLHGEVNDGMADTIVAQLLFLESQNPEKDINIYINSPGGAVTAGMAIYDTIKYIRPSIQTFCIGQAASMGAVILGAGEQGKRHILPSARVLIHQPWGGVEGQSKDIDIQAKEIMRLKNILISSIARDAGRKEKDVATDMDRDYFMGAQEAIAYGIVDHLMQR